MENIQYPIGTFTPDPDITTEKRKALIAGIAGFPAALRAATAGLSQAQLDTPYRDGGWTLRQVVHHLADAGMNCFTRFKLALTEDTPPIKAYDQDAWATTPDALSLDIGPSLAMIDGLYARWAALLSAMSPKDFARAFLHPERGPSTLDHNLQLYSWHGRHHVAHITSLRERKGWR